MFILTYGRVPCQVRTNPRAFHHNSVHGDVSNLNYSLDETNAREIRLNHVLV